MVKIFFAIACILGGLAVALGAFGAHALEGRVEARLLDVFETGVRYHFYHAIAIIVAAVGINYFPSSSLPVIAGWLFIVGIVIFSGSLYLLTFTGKSWLGAITPIGGVAFIAGWICLTIAALRS